MSIQDGNQVIEFKRSQSFKKNFDKNGNSIGIASASTFTVSTTVIYNKCGSRYLSRNFTNPNDTGRA